MVAEDAEFMSDILTDLTPAAVIYAAKRNLYDFFGYLRHWEACEFYETPVLQRWWTPVPYPWFNGALSLQALNGDAPSMIRETLAYFKAKGNQVVTWWLPPELERSAWADQLQRNGLNYTADTPGMAADLGQLNQDLPYPTGLEIQVVADADGIAEWASVFVEGYGLPVDWESGMLGMMLALGLGDAIRCYLARLEGENVAASCVFYSAGAAGIYCVATRRDWRGRGIGAAVTLQPLLDARHKGYRLGVLQSSEMGYSVYERMGFREVCKVAHHYWTDSA